MEKLNNPAARFHSLLKKGQSQKKDEQCAKVWGNILDVPSGDTSLLLRRMGHVMELPSLIALEIRELPNVNHDIHLKWLPRVNASIGIMNFQNPWKTFIDRFDAEILYGIEICADALSRSRPEKIISESLLKELSDKVAKLQEELSNEDIPISVANFIMERLEEIRLALEEYPYRGSAPLERALENTVGKVVICPTIYKECQSSNYGKKFWELMGYLAISVTITTGAIQIGKDVVSLLPSPEKSSVVEGIINSDHQGKNATPLSNEIDGVIKT